MTTVTINGNKVECYGEWRWDSNAVVVGTWPNDDGYEEIYADGADSWEHLATILEPWAKRIGLTIDELSAC